jgi:hypothetical protein
MGRIRISGNRDKNGKLLSVSFSNKSGGSVSLPVRDEHEPDDTDEQPEPKRPRLSFAAWATKYEDGSER